MMDDEDDEDAEDDEDDEEENEEENDEYDVTSDHMMRHLMPQHMKNQADTFVEIMAEIYAVMRLPPHIYLHVRLCKTLN